MIIVCGEKATPVNDAALYKIRRNDVRLFEKFSGKAKPLKCESDARILTRIVSHFADTSVALIVLLFAGSTCICAIGGKEGNVAVVFVMGCGVVGTRSNTDGCC